MNKQHKHKNYEILNLIGYGLAKFDTAFVKFFDFDTKIAFYDYIVQCKIADTLNTVKNRQDLFDPFFENGRRGWWQKGDAYIHRKLSIDAFFGLLDARDYADVVKTYLHTTYGVTNMPSKTISPATESRFKKLQETGCGAELYFMSNYQKIPLFAEGVLEDARMLGDGYDFQISVGENFFLAETKGLHDKSGGFRMTGKEFEKAKEYGDTYALVIVSNLCDIPKMHSFMHPIDHFYFTKKVVRSHQFSYHSKFLGCVE